jgi:ssDNA-binding replication factor A large subunit
MVREYVEIGACESLEALIRSLEAVRLQMPPGASGEQVRLRGDDVFGRHILVTYMRPERPEEIEASERAAAFALKWRARAAEPLPLSRH